MTDLWRDLRTSLRALARAPSTTAAAIAIIAVGTGINLAVFAVTYGVLLRPLPYAEASRLVILSGATPDGGDFGLPLSELDDWQQRLRTVSGVAGYAEGELSIRAEGEARLVRGAAVTRSFFDVLAVEPLQGRLAAFHEPGTAIISERLVSELGRSDVDPIGRAVRVGDVTATIGAVMPPAFAFPADGIDVWIRAPDGADERAADQRKFRLIARLAPGVTVEQMRDDATRVLYELRGFQHEAPGAGPLKVIPIEDAVLGGLKPVLAATMAAALLVLLVTCGNVAMLLLSRASMRRRDSAVRLALGAGWRYLVRGSLIESLVLAVSGSLGGLWLAVLGLRIFDRVAVGLIPRAAEVRVDWPVLAAGLTTVIAVTLLCGAAPALDTARRDFAATFRAAVGERRTHRMLTWLVAVQVAASVVLLTGAGLLGQTFYRLLAEDTGVESSGVLTAKLSLGHGTGSGAVEKTALVDSLLRRVRALPGVQEAGVGSSMPPDGLPFQVYIHWRTEDRDEGLRISAVSATAGFLEALGARRVAGRWLDETDQREDRPAILLSETAARFYSPGRDVPGRDLPDREAPGRDIVGRDLPIRLPPMSTISEPPPVAGIVEDVKYAGLDQPAAAAFYLPWTARPTDRAYLAVRTDGDPMALSAPVRDIFRELAPGLPVPALASLDDTVARSVADRRLRVIPALGFAAVALAVAVTGIFALFSRAVAERRRELAVRMALGATRSRVQRRVLRQAAVVTSAGLVVGLVASLFAAAGLRSLLFGIAPHDPMTLVAALAVAALASLAAAWWPASRASRVEPWELLRTD